MHPGCYVHSSFASSVRRQKPPAGTFNGTLRLVDFRKGDRTQVRETSAALDTTDDDGCEPQSGPFARADSTWEWARPYLVCQTRGNDAHGGAWELGCWMDVPRSKSVGVCMGLPSCVSAYELAYREL